MLIDNIYIKQLSTYSLITLDKFEITLAQRFAIDSSSNIAIRLQKPLNNISTITWSKIDHSQEQRYNPSNLCGMIK